jgi:hypothetical protein
MFRKKVVNKGNLRKPSFESKDSSNSSDKDGSDDDDNENNEDMLARVKYQQEQRARKSGLSRDALSKSASAHKSSKAAAAAAAAQAEEDRSKTVEDSMDNQFSAQTDTGFSGNSNPHEKIMNEYIKKQLGVAAEADPNYKAESSDKALSAEDRLYKIPEAIDIKSQMDNGRGQIENKSDSDISGVGAAWSAGIAEVALPMSFKLKNIKETEQARDEAEQRGYNANGTSSSAGS